VHTIFLIYFLNFFFFFFEASNAMIEGKAKTIFDLQIQVTNLNKTVVRLQNRLESVSQLPKESNPKPNKEAERDQYEVNRIL